MSIFWNKILNLIWPEKCLGCQVESGDIQQGFCAECRKELILWHNLGGSDWHIFQYQGPIQKALCDYKYQKKKSYGLKFAQLAYRFITAQPFPEFDLIMPVPLHWRKEFNRGFNQVTLMGLYLGKMCQKPLVVRNLIKKINTPSQTQLNEPERKKNVTGSFSVRRPHQVANQRILLLDDVYTTGATTAEATRALRQAGAKKVIILTIAKT